MSTPYSLEISGGPHYDPDLFHPNGKLGRFCKGGGPAPPKKLSRSQIRKEEKRQDKRALKQAAKIAKLNAPPAAPPPPPPPPPVATNRDAAAAEAQTRLDAQSRSGQAQTIIAGETGGYKPLKKRGMGDNTLLGG